jgi:hypothetical protein
MTTIGSHIGVPLDRFTNNRRVLIGVALLAAGSLAALLQ